MAYGLSIPTTQGIDATFDTYQYGSNSKADGIALFLAAVNPADPAPVAAIGQPGGYLGYAGNSSDGNGMVDGYLGLGLDVYGNYSNSSFDGSGCSLPSWPGWSGGAVADQVTVRGPGNGTTRLLPAQQHARHRRRRGGRPPGQHHRDQRRRPEPRHAVPVEVAINPGNTAITTASGLTVPAGDYEIAFTPIGGSRQTLRVRCPPPPTGASRAGCIPSRGSTPPRGCPTSWTSGGWARPVATPTSMRSTTSPRSRSRPPRCPSSTPRSQQPQQRPARPGPDLHSGVSHRLQRQCGVRPDHRHRRLPERRDAILLWVGGHQLDLRDLRPDRRRARTPSPATRRAPRSTRSASRSR